MFSKARPMSRSRPRPRRMRVPSAGLHHDTDFAESRTLRARRVRGDAFVTRSERAHNPLATTLKPHQTEPPNMANEKNQPEKVPGQDIPPSERKVGPAADAADAAESNEDQPSSGDVTG
jgi:hypothetical protein